MKLACVKAIAEPRQGRGQATSSASAYGGQELSSVPSTSSRSPLDPRLIVKIAPAVAHGDGFGAATKPIATSRPTASKLNAFVSSPASS